MNVNTAERFFRVLGVLLSGMTISTKGILLIKDFEGRSLQPYVDDDASTPGRTEYSIGYGHQIKPGEEYLMQGITEQKAEDLLISDLAAAIASVNNSITVPITQDQFDALCSYAFNIGLNGFKSGSLVKLINTGASKQAIQTWWLNHYITAAGKKSTTLETRRKKEFAMYNPQATTMYTASLMPKSTIGKVLLFSLAALVIGGAVKQKQLV